jgi:hypothetical protein
VASGNPPSRGALFSPDLLKNTANTTAACSYCTTHRGRYSAAVSPRTLTPASSLPDRMRTEGYRQPPLASSSCCHCWHLADHVAPHPQGISVCHARTRSTVHAAAAPLFLQEYVIQLTNNSKTASPLLHLKLFILVDPTSSICNSLRCS